VPELPEVETMCRGIAAVVGSRIVAVQRPRCRLRPIEITPRLRQWSGRVPGKVIVGLRRAGKRVVLQLESTDAIVIEPRMTGLVLLAEPPNRAHLRLRITLKGGMAGELLFWDRRGLGKVRLVTAAEFDAYYGPRQLGPDALTIDAHELRERLSSSRRAVKVALLDQKAVAGIGNLYASEILHVAGVHPARSCDRLKDADWERVHAAVRQVLEAAVICEGSTLSDGTYRNALNKSGEYQNHHRVYDKEKEVCLVCRRGIILRVVQAQRSTFFCPVCQPRSGRAVRRRPR
jgi:formamidopyrimidine-DNA glycosylase